MKVEFQTAFVFWGSGAAGMDPWTEQILADFVPTSLHRSTKNIVEELVQAGVDLSKLDRHGSRADLCGADLKNWRSAAGVRIYPVLVAGDQVYLLTPLVTDGWGELCGYQPPAGVLTDE